MKLPLYQVDAFTGDIFHGNPAAVCPLDEWLDDAVLQAIAAENNLSETAFFVPLGENYRLRWFTPVSEVDLCGHATLASAFVVFTHLDSGREEVVFETRSGPLGVVRAGDALSMDFPVLRASPCAPPGDLIVGLGAEPRAVLAADDYMAVFDDESAVRALHPEMEPLRRLDRRGVIATAPGDSADFVSRFFAPKAGIPEDPVTGSAHCTLVPYWSARLGRRALHARQVSMRGGEIECEDRGERVKLTGKAVQYFEGTISTEFDREPARPRHSR
jgi:predicted PhzF superfamily epimerase YddE/YHI9